MCFTMCRQKRKLARLWLKASVTGNSSSSPSPFSSSHPVSSSLLLALTGLEASYILIMSWWRISHTHTHSKAAGTIWKTLFQAPTRLRWASAPNDPAWARLSEQNQSEPSTLHNGQALCRPTSLLMSLGFFKSSFMDSLMLGHISRAARFSWVRRHHYTQSSPEPAFILLLLLFFWACVLIDLLCCSVAFDSRSPVLKSQFSYELRQTIMRRHKMYEEGWLFDTQKRSWFLCYLISRCRQTWPWGLAEHWLCLSCRPFSRWSWTVPQLPTRPRAAVWSI